MSHSESARPPQWPLRLIRYFIKGEYIEEIEGDMEEIFYDNLKLVSPRKARRQYTWEALKLLRPALIKNLSAIQTTNHFPMYQNYFKTLLRNLMKNPMSSFINIIGLSIAIGICVLVYGFSQWVNKMDQFHVNKNEVYLITYISDRDGALQQYGRSPRPLGEMMQQDFAQINKMCRVEDNNVIVKHKDNVFHEKVRFTDTGFLDMFTFPMKWGVSSSLGDLNSIILSEETSIKYFGDENPIGQDMEVIVAKGQRKLFKITGVAAAFPESHTIGFDFLVNFENLSTLHQDYDMSDWKASVNATLIQVNNPSDLKNIERGMDKYRRLQNEAQHEWTLASFTFEPLVTLYKRAGNMRNDISFNGYGSSGKSIIILSIIGLIMLTLACFNYINIAIVSAAKRLKEIGVRKSIGAHRGMVIIQFMSENIAITMLALVLGVALATLLFIPGFEQINDFNMGFSLMDAGLWIYLPIILLITGIASGIYPAFYISQFQVVRILKGSVQFSKKNTVTKVLLGFQLILACILITSAVLFIQNSNYVAQRSWGYAPQSALYIDVPDQFAFEQLSSVMAQNPNVLSISGSAQHLGKSNSNSVINIPPDQHYEALQLAVDAAYFETMGLKLTAGRMFNDHEGSDREAVIVNETFVNHISQGLGDVIEMDSSRYQIVGVVSDFHLYDFDEKIVPTLFKVAAQSDYRYLSLLVREGTERETYASLQGQWAKLFPETPFQGGYQQDVWGTFFETKDNHARFWLVIAAISVLLAGLGLYGIMALNVSGRIREFSIRKILGALKKNIARTIIHQYVLLFTIALLIGIPVSYIINNFLFDNVYAYHVPMNYLSVSISGSILILVLLATVFIQVTRVSKANPVEGIKVK